MIWIVYCLELDANNSPVKNQVYWTLAIKLSNFAVHFLKCICCSCTEKKEKKRNVICFLSFQYLIDLNFKRLLLASSSSVNSSYYIFKLETRPNSSCAQAGRPWFHLCTSASHLFLPTNLSNHGAMFQVLLWLLTVCAVWKQIDFLMDRNCRTSFCPFMSWILESMQTIP